MAFVQSTRAERSRAALAAAALTAALGYALIAGLALGRGASTAEALQIFEIGPEPPPPPREERRPHRRENSRREGAASPPNLRSEPTEIVAPEPVVPVPPPPVLAAPVAGVGSAPSAGSAEVRGPGTGSGGEGDGRGSGGAGDGSGDGGEGIPPRWVRGELKDSDYPDFAADAGIGGTVGVRYLVWTDGRVRDCEVTRSSGNRELDATTCRLIEARFRFRPSRDESGRAVPAVIVENHSWMIHQEPDEAPPPRRKRRFGW